MRLKAPYNHAKHIAKGVVVLWALTVPLALGAIGLAVAMDQGMVMVKDPIQGWRIYFFAAIWLTIAVVSSLGIAAWLLTARDLWTVVFWGSSKYRWLDLEPPVKRWGVPS